jgi:hypothetical protein
MIDSEIFLILCHIFTIAASKAILFSIRGMLHFERAFFRSWTLRQLIFCLSWNIITATLLLVAWFTEMCVTPAEPLGIGTTELAFEFYKIWSMFWTILDSTSHRNSWAFTTHKLFPFEILIIILTLFTVLHASKVRILAFEAHVVW